MHEPEAILAGESSPLESQSRSLRDQGLVTEGGPGEQGRIRGIWGLGLGSVGVLTIALAALVPTVGDFGLTWDEPAYRYSQVMSAQWWEQLGHVRSRRDVQELLDPLTLLYFWPYGRYGINFHPPLAGQLNLATYVLFGHWMKDIPARRMASVIEFALTITIGFHFLARRYGGWVGLVTAGSLLLMPRLYGQAHLIDTDTPGLLLWTATALAFWKGLHEPHARRWRVAVGILLGLAFIEKMGAVVVLLPLLLWLIVGYLPRTFMRPGGRSAWIDGIVHDGCHAGPAGAGVSADPDAAAAAPPAVDDRPLRRSPGERLAGSDPGGSAGGLVRPAPSGPVVPQTSRSGGLSGPRSRRGRRSWPLLPWSAGWATRPGGARHSLGWPTITRSASVAAAAPSPTSRSSISGRSMNSAFPGIMPGS